MVARFQFIVSLQQRCYNGQTYKEWPHSSGNINEVDSLINIAWLVQVWTLFVSLSIWNSRNKTMNWNLAACTTDTTEELLLSGLSAIKDLFYSCVVSLSVITSCVVFWRACRASQSTKQLVNIFSDTTQQNF